MGFVKGTDGIARTVRNPLEGSIGDITLSDVNVATLSASASITTSGNSVAVGNVSGGNVVATALVKGVTVQASGNLVGGNANISNGVFAVTGGFGGNVTAGNLSTGGLISAAGNISGANVIASGNVIVSGTGAISLPNLPGFRVYGSGNTVNLGNTINTAGNLTANNFAVDYNQGSYLDTSTGVFTAPVAGLYGVHLVARTSTVNNDTSQIAVYKNNTTQQVFWEVAANSTVGHMGVSTVSKLAVGDTLVAKILIGNVNFDSNDSWSVAFLG